MAKTPVLTEEEFKIFLKREKFGFALLAGFLCVPVAIWIIAVAITVARPFSFEQPVTIAIPKQSGFLDIAQILQQSGVIQNATAFKLYVLASGKAGSLRSGTYSFSGTHNVASIANRLAIGPEDTVVTIPEGFTVFDIDKRLSDAGAISAGDFINIAQQADDFSYPFLQSEYVSSLEGYLFPDTYRFAQRADVKTIADKMLKNFSDKVFNKMDEAIRVNQQSFASIITLASLVEKEVAGPDERRIVSGILWKRLERNMPLQVDASVVYAWKTANPDWKPKNHTLSAADVKIKSAYNTYLHFGLPPSPIANPGWDSIDAVLHPQESDYWYYLSAKDGKTIFSKTIEEHNAAKAKYL
ncbi:MAG: endolytic transglycosylase MltG [Candidatus Brennerbacteria bacterium CG_4_10_14_0_2_um_filter_43_14]|nr:MAG: endolytic transglycosylase MltG [Candidatus Brennerbacteria bacterium CG_4_10_14_0_2_um_filter_43_14]